MQWFDQYRCLWGHQYSCLGGRIFGGMNAPGEGKGHRKEGNGGKKYNDKCV